MNFQCQVEAVSQLDILAKANRQSVLIEGPSGCGKSYLSRLYASFIGVDDYLNVPPKVADIREAVDKCIDLNTPAVLCIENLDCGLPAASYTILKFLEEPIPNVYVIVTCRQLSILPETIISRSSLVSVNHPINSDLVSYAQSTNMSGFNKIYPQKSIWACAKNFRDVDTLLSLTPDQLQYFAELSKLKDTTDSISNIVWKLGHYNDNSESPVEIVIRYIMEIIPTVTVRSCGIDCMNDLLSGTIAKHAVLSKFAFNLKYME